MMVSIAISNNILFFYDSHKGFIVCKKKSIVFGHVNQYTPELIRQIKKKITKTNNPKVILAELCDLNEIIRKKITNFLPQIRSHGLQQNI